ncbi:cytochrome P450 [Fomitopsis serialis]|uniref:cytochrome P450 n=1 Tax=Fomitopsis serialis TaxID=139415 RepID=UPI00200746C4|nr:cytochrome P450 [Neoantrodia serialis]KAH9914221.1 cytochrome P450 [Neoantrodia serialis]
MNTTSVALLALVLLFVACLAHLLPYLTDPHALRSYPGPWLAKLSDVWLGRVAAQGHRSEVVHQLHKQYGTFVRLAPNHLSICDPDGIQDVYAHGNGTTKSDFYDAFVSITRGLFNTRSRADHTRKRKVVAHVFSQKSVLEFEPYTRVHVAALFRQWDRLCGRGAEGFEGKEGEGWRREGGRVWMDCLPWFNYLAFDIIGDLAFGAPFGMLQACADTAPTVLSQEAAMASYGSSGKDSPEVTYCPAVQIINERGEYSASIGVLPPRWRPWLVRFVPWYRQGATSVELLAGMAIAAISKRLAAPTERTDLLSKLQQGKDEEGRPLGAKELTADALTQLIAGSDTTSNSSCAIAYHLAANPDVQEKLQRELDAALGGEDDPVVTFEQVRRLPYLDAVINEGMRVHSTSGIGLPREVPTGGLTVCGRFFPEGTVLSVPTYTVHRNEDVWGSDADVFRPERWLERDKNELQKAFNPFSFGPRGCIGRNLASMELFIIVASVFRRYHFVLEDTSQKLDTKEGFLRKPVKCRVGVRRRATGIGM